MTNLAIMASGGGSLLQAMIDQKLPIQLVLSDKDCPAIQIGKAAGITTAVVDRRKFGYRKGAGEDWDRRGFSLTVAAVLAHYRIDLAAMAGFFTVLHPDFFANFTGYLLNTHPALLPAYPGEFAVRDALAAGETESGATIHIATEVMDDHRYIVNQVRGIPLFATDSVDEAWERIKVQERKLYPQTLFAILAGEIDLAQIKTL